MSSFLAEIAESTRARVAAARAVDPHPVANRRPHDFARAFAGAGHAVIAELKRRSPSQGTLSAGADPIAVASAYLTHGAAAISVLTESTRFGGDPDDLRAIRAAHPDALLLMKDFVIEEYQLRAALRDGADCVLLIVALLGAERTRGLHAAARALGLSVLVEVHTEAELEIAVALGAELIGVNNRDLGTLQVSLDVSVRLATRFREITRGRARPVLVAESGLTDARDLRRLSELGFRGFLVGTRLMGAADPGRALHELRADATSRVKICGIRRADDARLAAELGAWAVGFVFAAESPRRIDPRAAGRISAALPASVRKIGVFVNASRDEILRTAHEAGLDAVQLHGEEPPGALTEVPLDTIRAFRPRHLTDVRAAAAHRPSLAYLIDAYSPDRRGGTGASADPALVRAARDHGPLILAGGLRAENVAAAIRELNPYAVDVSSGVELSPGIKCAARLSALFAALPQEIRA